MHLMLTHKVNGAIIITFLLIAVIFSGIQLPFQQHRLQTTISSVEILMQTLVERDLEQLANEIFDSRKKAIKIRLKQMRKLEGILNISVFDQSGKLLISEGTAITNQDLNLKNNKKIPQYSHVSKRQWEGQAMLLYSQEKMILKLLNV